MNKIYLSIKNNPLLKGISYADFEQMFHCVQGRTQQYQKGEVIWLAGSSVTTIGIVLRGRVQILRSDAQGKEHLLAEVKEGELFGEVFACAEINNSPVTVMAWENTEILHMNYRKVISTCSSACIFHQKLISNMLALVAQKNLILNRKIEILSKRTTRERLLCYLLEQAQGKQEVTIPLNREELSAFLCVERSAMSAELSRMQKEGLLSYHRNTFTLHQET